MTDGTTGFQVAPITEDDMNRVTSILKRAADAIVGMSQLTADVNMLRDTVHGLQADADRLRRQNEALDEALHTARTQRHDLEAKLAQVETEARNSAVERDKAVHDLNDVARNYAGLKHDFDTMHTERDDAQFQVLTLQDELKDAVAKLEAFRVASETIFGRKPEAVPEARGESLSTILPPSAGTVVEGAGTTTSTPATEPFRPDTVLDWEPGYVWDYRTAKYWRDGLTPKHDPDDLSF